MGQTKKPGPIKFVPLPYLTFANKQINTVPPPVSASSQCNRGCHFGPAATPGPAKATTEVSQMSLEERFILVLRLTKPRLPGEIQEEFDQLLDPWVLGLIVGTLIAWAGSHYFGIGFLFDGLLIVAGALFLGFQIWTVIDDFKMTVYHTVNATTMGDLDLASARFANFVAVVGVAAVIALLTRQAAVKGGAKLRYLEKAKTWIASATDAGMPFKHFTAFKRAAADADKIVLVRQTNPKSIPWINKKFPPKPKELEFLKTSPSTGLATAKNADEIKKARNLLHSSGKQYYVVDKGGRTASNARGEVLDLANSNWPPKAGQVIDPVAKKPIPGDYDLMGVIDPEATGRNLALVNSHGKRLKDFSNTWIKDIARRVNAQLDTSRVLHGAEEAYGNWSRIKADEIVVAFFPDGRTVAYNRNALIELYARYGRKLLDMKSVGNANLPSQYKGPPNLRLVD